MSRRSRQLAAGIDLRLVLLVLAALVTGIGQGTAAAAERYAVVITGASAGEPYATKYARWRTSFVSTLTSTLGYPADHVIEMGETADGQVRKATRDNVRAAFSDLRARLTKDDLLFVLLIGHGSGADGDEAKFNLVGPDLGAGEWADLVKPLNGKVAFVNAASGSFPFLEKLAGPNRIVITADDSAAQQFETLFPEFFVKAFEEDAADFDKNGKVSLLEAFNYASSNVRRAFEEKGQLATERALIDDTGAGTGRDADTTGRDGPVAQVTYLAPDRVIPETGDAELNALLRRKAALENDLEALRARKAQMSSDDYETELERILLEIARIDRRTRTKS